GLASGAPAAAGAAWLWVPRTSTSAPTRMMPGPAMASAIRLGEGAFHSVGCWFVSDVRMPQASADGLVGTSGKARELAAGSPQLPLRALAAGNAEPHPQLGSPADR